MTNNKGNAQFPRSLSAKQVAQLNAKNVLHTAKIQLERPTYPDLELDELRGLLEDGDESTLALLGWESHNLFQRAEEVDFDYDAMQGFRLDGAKGRRHGKPRRQYQGKGKGKSKSGGKTLLNPQIVAQVVAAKIAASNLTPVEMTGPVKRAVWNLEFLTAAKAKWFKDAYAQIIPLAHIWSCCEVSADGMDFLAELTGYRAYTSGDNSRGSQAVSMLIHPRLSVTEEWNVPEVANVQGVHDLRPLHGVDLDDTSESDPDLKNTWAGVHHAKSMRGGGTTTSAIRFQQNVLIAKYLIKKQVPGTVGGDFNTIIGSPAGDFDISPLLEAGFKLVDPDDGRPTQIQGSRLDALFTLNFETDLRIEALLDWFNDATIGRGLTDHGSEIFS